MLWNYVFQAVFGFIMRNSLTWTTSGILICLVFTGALQAFDLKRIYSYSKERLLTENPEALINGRLEAYKKGAPYKLAQLWVFKVLWYGGVTMAIASISR